MTMQNEWQPIETAPKDGAFYIASNGDKLWQQNQPPEHEAGYWRLYNEKWYGGFLPHKATHWMPMIELPKNERE